MKVHVLSVRTEISRRALDGSTTRHVQRWWHERRGGGEIVVHVTQTGEERATNAPNLVRDCVQQPVTKAASARRGRNELTKQYTAAPSRDDIVRLLPRRKPAKFAVRLFRDEEFEHGAEAVTEKRFGRDHGFACEYFLRPRTNELDDGVDVGGLGSANVHLAVTVFSIHRKLMLASFRGVDERDSPES